MKMTGMVFWAAGMALSAAYAATGVAAETNWYAEVETTAGSFTIALDWERAPNGCGAFAALAEGRTGWVDPQKGRAVNGKEFFPGTALSWVQNDATGEEKLLLGNRGRVFAGADGAVNADNGAGVTLQDDIRDGGGRGLSARSVAMINAEGPDSLDGRWVVMLKDGDEYYGGRWSRIGTVASNWGVVESIAAGAREEGTGMLLEPATVTGMRVWSNPPEALEAWRAGKGAVTNWPAAGYGDAELSVAGTEGTLRCGWSPRSQYAVVHGGDLTAAANTVVWMGWNEGEEEAWEELPFQASDEGAMPFGKRHFCAVAEVGYPELTGPVMRGSGYGLLTEWQWGDGTREQYLHELDWNAGTGMVWKATEGGGRTNYAAVSGVGYWRGGAHSGELVMAEQVLDGSIAWTYYHYYRLGATGEDGTGRFRMTVFTGLGGTVEVWGDWGWVKSEKGKVNSEKRRGGKRKEWVVDGVGRTGWRGKAPPPPGWGGARCNDK